MGSNFYGFQIQKNQRTIQGEINRVLAKICKGPEVRTLGSGRTDAGVHALKQVVKVVIPLKIEARKLMLAMNSLIDPSIKVLSAHPCDESFHPIRDALSKEYHYLFCERKYQNPFNQLLISPSPDKLNFGLMRRFCEVLVGEHDFQAFYTQGTPVTSTVRQIFTCRIQNGTHHYYNANLNFPYYQFVIRGQGFLKQMVRQLVGTMWSVAQEKTSLEEVQRALKGEVFKQRLGPTAPAQGLYLANVVYPPLSDLTS